jgi:hypothetical protein
MTPNLLQDDALPREQSFEIPDKGVRSLVHELLNIDRNDAQAVNEHADILKIGTAHV